MRLVIREYLSMLKEDGELDRLLPDLLFAMCFEPLSRPGRGSRQYGVDLSAAGIDPCDGISKLFLFTIKAGDINRSNWNSGKQALHPSLDEIFEVYLLTHIPPTHQLLPKKVVVAFNGELKQDVQLNWSSYCEQQQKVGHHGEKVEIDLWNADKIAELIECHLLTEQLFPEQARKNLRKTIALADQPEEEPQSFYNLIRETLENINPEPGNPVLTRSRKKALRSLNLALNIVFHWCQEADNIKTPLLAAERTLLLIWDWLRRSDNLSPDALEEFATIYLTYLQIGSAFVAKLQAHCYVRDGLVAQGVDDLEYPLRVFEVIGCLSTVALAYLMISWVIREEIFRESLENKARATAGALDALIRNNPGALTPLFDEHSIDLALALLTLSNNGYEQTARTWVERLSMSILFAFDIGHHFPVSTDSFEDLIAQRLGKGSPKEELFNISTILPLLADWHVVLGMQQEYETFQNAVTSQIPKVHLQMWFPDHLTEDFLYVGKGTSRTGRTLIFRGLPSTFEELRQRCETLGSQQLAHRDSSCFRYGWPAIALIASRHFRTPVFPAFWLPTVPQPPAEE